jgi:ABC-type phosphate transport system substrate-binding protein
LRAHSKFLGATAALAVITMTNLPSAQAVTGVPFTNALQDRVYGAGSDTIFPVLNKLATAYMESDGCLTQAIGPAQFPADPPGYVGEPMASCQTYPNDAVNAADNIYENYDHDLIINLFPQGSNMGKGALCNQKTSADASGGANRNPLVPYVDFARSSSAPSSFMCSTANGGEAGTVIRFIAFARDAVSFTHWDTGTGGGAAVTNLTQAQMNDIWVDCTITDWGAVGGQAGDPINVYTAIAGSGTRSFFDGFVGGNSENCIPATLKDGNFANGERVVREHQMHFVENAISDAAATDEGNSIYYMSAGLHGADYNGSAGNSLIGSINGVPANETTVNNGTFPMSRDMYVAIRQGGPNGPTASGAARRFLGMVTPTATNGQNIGWICKAEAAHSEAPGTAGAGIETPTAGGDWYEIKKAAFAAGGMYMKPADAFGVRCTFSDYTVV